MLNISANQHLSKVAIPFFFIVLYGSGFVGTKYGLEYANPLSFLTTRFLFAALILIVIGLILSKPHKHSIQEITHIAVAGLLTVGVFSIGVFVSIDMGLSPSLSAMIISLQPILVALLASKVVGEKLNHRQWLGLALGLIGVLFVLSRNVVLDQLGIQSIAMSVLGLLGLSLGNLYQKRFCNDMNLFIGGAIQSASAGLACTFLLVVFSEYETLWSLHYIYALSYMTIGVSIGALSLLYIMIRCGSVSKVASIFYLVPVAAAFVSYLFFDEKLNAITLIGVVVVMLGISLTNKE
ncbi:MAG: drug/metabolite transporter (DMT)-like permease [Candidatus Endobugula sp.]|jgi:drug/metabolite transporter (DMT)-like permease